MSKQPIAAIAVGAVAAVLLIGAIQVQAALERAYPQRRDVEGLGGRGSDTDRLYLESGSAVRRLTGPLNALAADIYWIRAIQHYGDSKRRLASGPVIPDPPPMLAVITSNEYALLHPLLDITTTLDPRFKIAYRFGAVFLAEPYPRGAGRPDLARALLQKGIRAQPDKWEYMEDIGFVHYWYEHDYQAAPAWFQKASEVPGAPWWLRSLAATTQLQGGHRSASRVMWEAIRQSAEVDWLRQDAERRLDQLTALDRIDDLQRRVDQLTEAAGAAPSDWQSLVRAGRMSGIPLDPRRVPFELSAGRVQLSPRSPLWPLPQEPQAGRRPAS